MFPNGHIVYIFLHSLSPQHAMDVMDIGPDTQTDIFNIVAGILHIGNISFTEEGNYAVPEDDGCKDTCVYAAYMCNAS